MKEVLTLMLLGMFVLSLGFASADTMIAGKIYNADYTEEVEGANVTVTCGVTQRSNISLSNGAYAIDFDNTECSLGDNVTVYAIHPDYGFNTVDTVVNIKMPTDLNIGVANVPLVPEFGFVMGMLTILSAIGIFSVVRRD